MGRERAMGGVPPLPWKPKGLLLPALRRDEDGRGTAPGGENSTGPEIF